MRDIVLVVAFGLMVVFFLNRLKVANAEMLNLKEQNAELVVEVSALNDAKNTASLINLKMVNIMCKRDQRTLKNDNEYLVLIDKIN